MSLPYTFPLWDIAKQNGNEVGRLRYRWPSLTPAELNIHPRPCHRYSFFVLKGDVNLPTKLTNTAAAAAADCRFFNMWSFSQSASGKKTLPAWVVPLFVGAGFS